MVCAVDDRRAVGHDPSRFLGSDVEIRRHVGLRLVALGQEYVDGRGIHPRAVPVSVGEPQRRRGVADEGIFRWHGERCRGRPRIEHEGPRHVAFVAGPVQERHLDGVRALGERVGDRTRRAQGVDRE